MTTKQSSIRKTTTVGMCAVWMAWIFIAPPTRADLLVLSGDPIVWQFDDSSGALKSGFAGGGAETFGGMGLGPDGKIYVTGNTLGHGDVYYFNRLGQYLGKFGNDQEFGNIAFGSDGTGYVIGGGGIVHFDGTNILNNNFATNVTASDMAFGKDGRLYVADANRGIVRYDGNSGAYVDTFVPLGTGGLPDVRCIIFGPDGNLYVCSQGSNAIVRFDGSSGQFIDYFVPPGSGGLDKPNGLVFGADGNLYVLSYNYTSYSAGAILRYDGQTGMFLNVFATNVPNRDLLNSHDLLFLPPPPQLKIQPGGDNTVQISWPSAAGNSWTLCRQQNLGATNAWAVVTNSPVLTGSNYVVTGDSTSTGSFYRLEQR